MLSLKILGIYRHPLFSNNAIEADRLILEHSLAELERVSPFALEIQMVEEAEAKEVRGSFDLVLTMAQREDTLAALERNLGNSPVWNSSAAIRNCYRMTMSRTLISLNVGYVPFQVLSTAEPNLPELKSGQSYWLKRSDFHAISNDDVVRATGAAEIEEKLAKFRARGVEQVILQAHIEGDIYKFYGVRGRFFRPIRVKDVHQDSVKPDFTELERLAARSAEALGLMIYGGDAILDSEGKFHLIDLNDWPSFRICREDASRAIADLALAHLSRRAESIAQLSPASSATLA